MGEFKITITGVRLLKIAVGCKEYLGIYFVRLKTATKSSMEKFGVGLGIQSWNSNFVIITLTRALSFAYFPASHTAQTLFRIED
jgi:hypothetical protein